MSLSPRHLNHALKCLDDNEEPHEMNIDEHQLMQPVTLGVNYSSLPQEIIKELQASSLISD